MGKYVMGFLALILVMVCVGGIICISFALSCLTSDCRGRPNGWLTKKLFFGN